MNLPIALHTNKVNIEGREVTIRPIRSDDTLLQKQLIEDLSEQAKHYRFLGGIRQLSDKDLQWLCEVDYHDSMAFVALIDDEGETHEVGVARYAKDTATLSHEMAVTIANDFRLSELGKVLVEHLIAYAREHGVMALYSMDDNDNTDMRKLAKDLGMSVRLDPKDAHQVIYSLQVDKHPETVVFGQQHEHST